MYFLKDFSSITCHIFPKVAKVWMIPDDWKKLDGGIETPVSRTDLMTVLANLDSILVRATHGGNMRSTKIK